MRVRARVRGIYSTAISKILNDNGVELVDVSPVIARRLGIDESRGKPADVTVKSDENNPSQVLVLGFPEEVEIISDILESTIPDVITYKPKIGLYASFKARVIAQEGRECIAETPVGPASLVDEPECKVGRELPVTVVKVAVKPNEKNVVSSRVRVVGKYAIVGRGSGVSFSNFIRNKERISKLLEISAKYVRQGISIRWRSNADEADLNEVISEIPKLIKMLEDVEKRLAEARPLEIVYVGEFMRFIELTYNSKKYLDKVRNTVAPTTPYHHIFRTDDIRNCGLVDLLDTIAKDVGWNALRRWISEWLTCRLSNKRDLTIVHRRITKKDIILGRAKPQLIEHDGKSIKMVLRRNVRSRGIYDGLNVPKEAGDIIETYVEEGKWFVVHKYIRRDGTLKGMYVNINTPPEILPSGQIQYTDLEVDMAVDSGGCRLLDSEHYLRLIREGYISTDIMIKVIGTLNSLINKFCVESSNTGED